MNAEEANLYSLYDQCLSKGCTDMQDETQSLKAKVIATDLGDYSDSTVKIEECYDLWIGEANALYEAGEYKDVIYII